VALALTALVAPRAAVAQGAAAAGVPGGEGMTADTATLNLARSIAASLEGTELGRAERARPFARLSASAAGILDSLVSRARGQLGTRYVLGGERPGQALDCSSFARYVMQAVGVRLPRTAAQQARLGTAVPRDRERLRPGDLLTFSRGRRVSHVGIYLGEGRFIHASPSSGRVIETTIERNPRLFRGWSGARRLVALDDSLARARRGE
jgi:cell wall-associated NlpC family hydrolase